MAGAGELHDQRRKGVLASAVQNVVMARPARNAKSALGMLRRGGSSIPVQQMDWLRIWVR